MRGVRRLRFQSQMGEWCDMRPVADDLAAGVTFFAVLLPWTTGVAAMQGLDADGQVLAQDRPRTPPVLLTACWFRPGHSDTDPHG